MSFAVVVGTFGDPLWRDLASRALASAEEAGAAEVIHIHADSLDVARNTGAAHANAEWLVFLDADDELDSGYVKAMEEVATPHDALLQPSTLGINPDGTTDAYPVLIPRKQSLLDGNWMVIGTAIRRSQFLRLGGFRNLPVYEDWDLWIRATLDGAQHVVAPQAVYRIHVNPTGRNSGDRQVQLQTYERIRREFR
jgi:glycosyltransferase involved in cell wall biosynthesis